MIDPNELTGEFVKSVRTKHKIGREEFQRLAGIGGKSAARLANIENKESWKDGDRDAIARVIAELEGEAPASWLMTSQSTVDEPDPIDRHAEASEEAALYVTWLGDDEFDADDDTLVSVVAPAESHVTPPELTTDVSDTWDLFDNFDDDTGVYADAEDVEPFVITGSQAGSFRRCKRKWWLEWYRQLQLGSQDLMNARATGSRVHKALQAYYVGDDQTRVDPRDALERILTDDWTTIYNNAVALGHDDFVLAGIRDQFTKTATLERAMIEGYVEWLAETGADAELKIISSETPVVAHLFEHTRSDGIVQTVHTAGLLDARVLRTSDGVRLFVDHKTVGDTKSPAKTLPQNEQMLHYHLIEWLSSGDTDERCDGALYNMLRKVKRTATAKPPFYERMEVRHNQQELESYKRRLIATTTDILTTIEKLDAGAHHLDVAYPTPTSNCSWDCDFFAVCTMFDDGSHVEAALDSLYTKVDPNTRYDTTKEQ